jgi:hypothetical protein
LTKLLKVVLCDSFQRELRNHHEGSCALEGRLEPAFKYGSENLAFARRICL